MLIKHIIDIVFGSQLKKKKKGENKQGKRREDKAGALSSVIFVSGDSVRRNGWPDPSPLVKHLHLGRTVVHTFHSKFYLLISP